MTPLRSLKVMAVSGIALAGLVAGEVSQAVAEGFLVAEENRMTELVNAHRAEHGVPQLRPDPALQMVARRQASRMVAAGYIYHNPDLAKEAEQAVPQWLSLGENVGIGAGVEAVQNAFLASPAHHANIDQSAFDLIGLGATPSSNGAMYFTQNFARGPQGGGASAPTPGGGPAPAAAGSAATAGQTGVVSTCQRRGRRLVCPRARRPARRTRARVRGIQIERSQSGETPKVTFVGTVGGMLGRLGAALVWWN